MCLLSSFTFTGYIRAHYTRKCIMKKTTSIILMILVLSLGISTGCGNDSCIKRNELPEEENAKMEKFPKFNATDFKDMPIDDSVFVKSPVTVVN